jgi:Ser/Thr protein kinase RdoA (MazF antagonist)
VSGGSELRDFESLTPSGRVRRLRATAEAALRRCGIEPAALRLLSSETNTVFRARAADGRAFVVRVGSVGLFGHTAAQARSETAWLAGLARSGAAAASVPVPGIDGDPVGSIEVPGVPGPRVCVVFEWVPGPLLDDRASPATFADYGRLAARLHTHAAGFVPDGGGTTLRYDEVFPFEEPVVLFEGDHPYLARERRARFVFAAAATEELIASLAAEPMRVIHGDLHVWNVVAGRGGPTAIDFEDHMWGWPIQDLGIALYYVRGRPDYPALFEAFRGGYESVAAWPERRPGDLDRAIAARLLVIANDVILLERAGEPGVAGFEFFDRADRRLAELLPGA